MTERRALRSSGQRIHDLLKFENFPVGRERKVVRSGTHYEQKRIVEHGIASGENEKWKVFITMDLDYRIIRQSAISSRVLHSAKPPLPVSRVCPARCAGADITLRIRYEQAISNG